MEQLGKRLGCGLSNHHEVVTQPRERAHERSIIGLGGEKNYALVLRLGGACPRPRNGFANAVLDTCDCRRIARPDEPLEQLGQGPRHQIERPSRALDHKRMRAGRQHQKRHRQCDDASDRDLQHPIDCGFDRAHMDEPGN